MTNRDLEASIIQLAKRAYRYIYETRRCGRVAAQGQSFFALAVLGCAARTATSHMWRHGLQAWCRVILLEAWLPTLAGFARHGDRQALVELYQATGGASWALQPGAPDDHMMQPGGNHNWDIVSTDPLVSDPCPRDTEFNKSWMGASCDDPCYYPIDGENCRFGRITGLQLSHNNLVGTLPDSLFDQLINLTIIDLSHNQLSGTIPTTIGRLRNIATFSLAHNRFSGTIPTEIRNMGSHAMPEENAPSLELINELTEEYYNSTGGLTNFTIDDELLYSFGLSQFDVSHNNLNGTLPTTIGELSNLEALDVSSNPDLGADGCCVGADSYFNSFYGYNTTIPTEIGNLRKLQVFRMDWSRFMRQIPTEVGNLRSLKYWRLQGSFTTNQVSGSIPTEFGRLSRLVEFMMENNTLSGTIPNEITSMDSLETFQVQDNQLSGTLPQNIGDLQNLYYWDTFGNSTRKRNARTHRRPCPNEAHDRRSRVLAPRAAELEGDMPSSIAKLGGSIEYLYIQNEHTDSLRNYYCQQRISDSAIGRKHNWQVIANEYIKHKYASACVNPYDVHRAFEALSGDV